MQLSKMVPMVGLAGGALFFLADPAAADDSNEVLIGTDEADVIDGEGGDDLLAGLEGDDSIEGGTGDDTVLAGDGDDSVSGGDGDDTVFAGDGDDEVLGGAGEDVLVGDDGDDQLDGGADDDFVAGGADDDVVIGGDGDDAVSGDTLCGDEEKRALEIIVLPEEDEPDCFGDDTVDGGAGDDLVFGDADFITGYTDREELEAFIQAYREADDPLTLLLFLASIAGLEGGGDDVVIGGAGNDALFGGSGNDVLCGDLDDTGVFGGLGADVPCPADNSHTTLAGVPVSGAVVIPRDLDDLILEVDEDGNPNPLIYVVVVAPTKGVVVLDSATGAYTYTPNVGASGNDSFEVALRRRIPDCENFSVITDGDGNFCRGIEVLRVVDEGGESFVESLAATISILIQAPVVPQAPTPPVIFDDGATLPVTGTDPAGLAMTGFGLLGLGAFLTAEGRRRRRGGVHLR